MGMSMDPWSFVLTRFWRHNLFKWDESPDVFHIQNKNVNEMSSMLEDIGMTLRTAATSIMTLTLVMSALVTIIGVLMFVMRRRLNKYMFIGFIFFMVCSILFTKLFNYSMTDYDATMSSIFQYAVLYIVFQILF